MKVCVQWASSGSPASAAARIAAAGASRRMLQPRYASQMSNPSATRMPRRPIGSDSLEQDVDIQCRALAEILSMRVEERLRGFSALVAEVGEEWPFRDQLRGRA